MKKISKSHTTPRFEKNFKNLPRNLKEKATKKILQFEKDPDYPSLKTHKLKGDLEGLWAFSINRDYRVMFRFIKKSEVIYYDIGTHDIYK